MSRSILRASKWLTAASLLGCPGERGPTRVEPAIEAAAPPIPAPPPTIPAPRPDTDPPLALHLVAQRDGPLQLHIPKPDAVAVVAAPGFALLGPDDQLFRDPTWTRGLAEIDTNNADLLALAFDGDRPTWLVAWSRQTRTQDHHLVFRWAGDRWRRVRNESGVLSWHYAGVAPWHGGQLGLRVHDLNPDYVDWGESDDPYRLREQAALLKRLANSPHRFEVVSGAVGPPPPRVPRMMKISSFITLPAGDVLALVEVPDDPNPVADDEDRPTLTAVARWPVGATRHRLENLPDIDEQPELHLSPGTAPGTAFVYGEDPYLASDAGGAWTKLGTPDDNPLVSLAAGPGDVLWAVSDGDGTNQLWRRDDGQWRRIQLAPVRFASDARTREGVAAAPDAATREWPVEPVQVHMRGADDLWIVGTTEAFGDNPYDDRQGRYVVLRSRPATAVLELVNADLYEWMDLEPWRPGTPAPERLRYPPERKLTRREEAEDYCHHVFVTLGDPSPAVEAALVAVVPGLAAKHRLEVDLAVAHVYDRDVIGMGISVPGHRQEAVPPFVAAVARTLRIPKPLTRCHAPKVVRSFGPPGVPQPEPPAPAEEDELE